MLKDLGHARVIPYGGDGICNFGGKRGIRIGIHGVVNNVVAVVDISRGFGDNVELAHGCDEGFGTVDDVFVDGMSIQGELVCAVAILMDDFHLLDDCGLATFARAWEEGRLLVSKGMGACSYRTGCNESTQQQQQ